MSHVSDMVTRALNARQSFVNSIVEQFNYSIEDAEKILYIFKRERIIKLDVAIGRYQLKHGAFWSRLAFDNAIKLYNEECIK